jgi:hypothetical protein
VGKLLHVFLEVMMQKAFINKQTLLRTRFGAGIFLFFSTQKAKTSKTTMLKFKGQGSNFYLQ